MGNLAFVVYACCSCYYAAQVACRFAFFKPFIHFIHSFVRRSVAAAYIPLLLMLCCFSPILSDGGGGGAFSHCIKAAATFMFTPKIINYITAPKQAKKREA